MLNSGNARHAQGCTESQNKGHLPFRLAVLISCVATAGHATTVQAQSASRASPIAIAETFAPTAVVAEVRRVLGERYVLPERRAALDAVLANGLKSGRYDAKDGRILAERLNADLERVGQDRHLTFRFDPREAAVIAAGSVEVPGANPAFERLIRRANHGITELRVLAGNVRLMTYDGFHWTGAESAAALETALKFLAGGDAVIIDLRGNGGGNPEAVQFIISRFLKAGTPLTTFHMNGSPEPKGFVALAVSTKEQMIGKPLYVLTSRDTGSAAEEFTGHVVGYRLGQIVGQNTAGAAYRNDIISIARQFVFGVSVGRPVLASTGKDWERVGHAPTIKTDAPAALDMAHAAALRTVVASLPSDERPSIEAMAEAVEARALMRTPTLPLMAYTGVFGERTVTTDGVRLSSQRSGNPKLNLIPLGGHRFAFEATPLTKVIFEASGQKIQAMTMDYAGGPIQPAVKRATSR